MRCSAFHRLHEEHLVSGPKAVGDIKRATLGGGMQCDYPDPPPSRFRKGQFYEMACQLAPPVLRLDVDIQQIAALRRNRIERMRRPVK